MTFWPDFADHAAYVWSAYAIAGLVILVMLVMVVARARNARRKLRAIESELAARRKARPGA